MLLPLMRTVVPEAAEPALGPPKAAAAAAAAAAGASGAVLSPRRQPGAATATVAGRSSQPAGRERPAGAATALAALAAIAALAAAAATLGPALSLCGSRQPHPCALSWLVGLPSLAAAIGITAAALLSTGKAAKATVRSQ